MELFGKNILIVGLGVTGASLARFLVMQGAVVTITDRADEKAVESRLSPMQALGVQLELGGHNPETFEQSDLIVLSPGVPETLFPVMQAREKGVRICGEIELASRFINEPIIAVTGTNGKTTTTALIGDMLARSGYTVFVGGNIGNPLIDYVSDGKKADRVVVEVSSFQLDTIEKFRPNVGVLLNITADHLDRYPDFDAYARSKMRLFKNQQDSDTAVLNGGDPLVREMSRAVRCKTLFFNGMKGRLGARIHGSGLELTLGDPAATMALDLSQLRLEGRHNVENVAAASLAALAGGAALEGVQLAISCFNGLPHRMAYVDTVDGIRYFNDSKATNVDSVARALDAFDAALVLIMGGRDKGGDFHRLTDLMQRHVKTLILLGEAEEAIASAVGRAVPIERAGTMAEAVQLAHRAAAPGDVVLLSPGCASFDMYSNYAHRGNSFCEAVEHMKRTAT